MTFQETLFRQFYVGQGSANAASSYLTSLRKAEKLSSGLDEIIESKGAQGLIDWVEAQAEGVFPNARSSDVRSAVRKYANFRADLSVEQADELFIEAEQASQNAGPAASILQYEQQLQQSVREQIAQIEAGLFAIDDGKEKPVTTGKIDILARDANGRKVVIELKAGTCPSSALEQVLGYAADIDAEDRGSNEACRAILIAGDFTARTRHAARRVKDLTLMRYSLQLSFAAED